MRELNGPKSLSEQYIEELYPTDISDLVQKARDASVQFGKAGISMAANESRMLALFIKMAGAKKFIEVGTLTGATGLWISEAMGEDSKLWTFERVEAHARAAENIFVEYMKLNATKMIKVMIGDAQERLKDVVHEGPFDGIFIDGNKAAYGKYLEWSENNIRKGGLIISDNIFLGGGVYGSENARFSEKQVQVMRAFNSRIADPLKYFSAIVPTSEGLSVAIKLF